MKASKAANNDRKLMDQLIPSHDHGRLLGIFCTTYEMQSDFIEQDFLPTLFGLGAWDDRSQASRIAIEKCLAELDSATLMMDARNYRGRPRTLRVEVKPVSLSRGRILHAKALFCIYEEAVKLFVGSANLTSPGYRHNREVVAVLTASRNRPQEAKLIADAINGLKLIIEAVENTSSGQFIDETLARVESWSSDLSDQNRWFVWGGGEQPLWKQFLNCWPKSEAVQRITIVSPFWSEELENGPVTTYIQELKNWCGLESGAELHLLTKAVYDAEESYKLELPESFNGFDAGSIGIKASAIAVDPRIQREDTGLDADLNGMRSLHAKILLMEGPNTSQVYAGSANFTGRGWGFLPSPKLANIEAGLIIQKTGKAGKALRALIPRTTGAPTPLTGAAKINLISPQPLASECMWPGFINDILLVPAESNEKTLEMHISVHESAPGHWRITHPPSDDSAQNILLSIDPPANDLTKYRVPLTEDAVNRLLREQEVLVQWKDCPDGILYPINVNAEARRELPISPGTGRPEEQHLISYYQGKIAWEDLFPDPKAALPDDANPSIEINVVRSEVDTSRIQSYIVREFVEALSGIKSDLRSAALSTKSCMQLALLGPVSPIALANRIKETAISGERSPTAAGFQLVEIHTSLQEARLYNTSARYKEDWGRLIDEATVKISSMLETLQTSFASEFTHDFKRYADRLHEFHQKGTRNL